MERGGVVGESLYWATSTLFSRAGRTSRLPLPVSRRALLLTGRRIGELVGGPPPGGRPGGNAPQRVRARPRRRDGTRPASRSPRATRGSRSCSPRATSRPADPGVVAAEDDALESEEDPLTRVEREIQGTVPPRSHRGRRARSLAADPPGQAALRGDRVRGAPLPAARPEAAAQVRQEPGPDTSNQDQIAKLAGRVAGPFRHRGEDRRARHRSARHAPRAAARAGHQGLQGHAAQGRHRLRARLDRHPHPRPDSRQAGRRRGGAQQAPPDGLPGRHLPPRPR